MQAKPFGDRFNVEDVRNFKRDVSIDKATELTIGGTRNALFPLRGGETSNAMFIELPDHGVMFVGIPSVPYLGAPFVERGDLQRMIGDGKSTPWN